jgi:hypothetical protein
MKKFFFIFLLLPLASFSQCDLIGSKADVAKAIIEKNLPDYKFNTEESTGDYLLFGSKDENAYAEIEVKDGLIKRFVIVAPAGKIDSLFANIAEQVKGCSGYKQQGQWVRFNKSIMVWESDHNPKRKVLSIEKEV